MDVVLESQDRSEFPGLGQQPKQSSVLVSTAERLQAPDYAELVAEVHKLRQKRVSMVSIRRQSALRIGPEKFHAVLEDSGLKVCTVGFAGGFTGTLGRSYRQAVDDTRRALEYAARLKARAVVVLPGSRGLHTYNHSERTVRDGFNDCLDDALRFRIDMVIPLNDVFGNGRDVFTPQNLELLDWIQSFDCHRIKPMMLLRGGNPWRQLPASWQQCLLKGGVLRASNRCRSTVGRHGLIRHIQNGLSGSVVPVS